jgi:Tetratricopeptide repeat
MNTKSSFIIAGVLIPLVSIFVGLTNPELRCFFRLNSTEICQSDLVNINFSVESQKGVPLPEVEVKVMLRGAPEITRTDASGYATVKILKKGDVQVIFSKPGFETARHYVNLDDPSKPRTFRLKEIDPPSSSSTPTPPDAGKDVALLTFEKARSLQESGQYRQAIALYNKVIQSNDTSKEVCIACTWANRALCFEQLGETENAINSYIQALGISEISWARERLNALQNPSSGARPPTNSERLNDYIERLTGRSCSLASEAEYLYGKYSINWTHGGQYKGVLEMDGVIGAMTVFYNEGSKSVKQTMILSNCTQGMMFLGFDPVLPETGTPDTNYNADNILIRQNVDGSIDAENCDDKNQCAPVEISRIN